MDSRSGLRNLGTGFNILQQTCFNRRTFSQSRHNQLWTINLLAFSPVTRLRGDAYVAVTEHLHQGLREVTQLPIGLGGEKGRGDAYTLVVSGALGFGI